MKCPHCGETIDLPVLAKFQRWQELQRVMERDPRMIPVERLGQAYDDLLEEIAKIGDEDGRTA